MYHQLTMVNMLNDCCNNCNKYYWRRHGKYFPLGIDSLFLWLMLREEKHGLALIILLAQLKHVLHVRNLSILGYIIHEWLRSSKLSLVISNILNTNCWHWFKWKGYMILRVHIALARSYLYVMFNWITHSATWHTLLHHPVLKINPIFDFHVTAFSYATKWGLEILALSAICRLWYFALHDGILLN